MKKAQQRKLEREEKERGREWQEAFYVWLGG
jgi:hypothetical protein